MKPLAEQTHYEVLEVEPAAARSAVAESYQRLRKLLGPGSLAVYSLVDPAEQQALVLRLDEAWAVLSDPAQRRAYDVSIGIAPAEPAPAPAPARSSFADALQAIRAAGGGGEDEETAPVPADAAEAAIVPEPEPEPEPEEIALDDEDLLEIVEIGGAWVAQVPPPALELAPEAAPADEALVLVESDAGEAIVAAEEIGAEEEPAPAAADPIDAFPAIDDDTHFSGALLRQLREARGLSLDEIARRTRIGANHLDNIEAERWAELPERVFLRGYLDAYARELRLDPTQVCVTYLARRENPRRR